MDSTLISPPSRPASVMRTSTSSAVMKSGTKAPAGLATLTSRIESFGQGNNRAEMSPPTVTWRPVTLLP